MKIIFSLILERLAHLVKVDLQALLVCPERLEDQEKWEKKALLVHWVLKERQESLVHRVCLDSLGKEVCLDFL